MEINLKSRERLCFASLLCFCPGADIVLRSKRGVYGTDLDPTGSLGSKPAGSEQVTHPPPALQTPEYMIIVLSH